MNPVTPLRMPPETEVTAKVEAKNKADQMTFASIFSSSTPGRVLVPLCSAPFCFEES